MLTEKDITVGCDPEFFITYNEDGKEFCAPPILLEEKGLPVLRKTFREDDSKLVKHSYYIDETFLKIMSDGAALELTVNPVPLNNLEELFNSIQMGYEISNGLINPFGYNLAIIPTIPFDIIKFNSNEKYKTASQFGCDEDWDAWDDEFVCKTFDVKNYPYRHGGGHIHLGIPKEYIEKYHDYARIVVRFLSMTVGSYFLINSPQRNLDKMRMSYYGKPGKYRIPEHGIEYRSPSNAWTTDKDILLNSKEWILMGLNLLLHENGEEILYRFSNLFLNSFNNQDYGTLQQIMEDIKDYYD